VSTQLVHNPETKPVTTFVTLGSAPGINTRYRPALRALYGDVAIRDIYVTTECMFG